MSTLKTSDLESMTGLSQRYSPSSPTMDEVAKWLGHSSVRVTERHYAFLRVEHLHRALARNVVKLKRG